MRNQLNLHDIDPNHFNTKNDSTRKENKNYIQIRYWLSLFSQEKIDVPNYFLMFTLLIDLIFDERRRQSFEWLNSNFQKIRNRIIYYLFSMKWVSIIVQKNKYSGVLKILYRSGHQIPDVLMSRRIENIIARRICRFSWWLLNVNR